MAHISTLPETKQAGIKLDVKNFTDYVAMNTAANKEIDVNAFQSYAYMVAYNDANTQKIARFLRLILSQWGSTKQSKKVEEFKTGARLQFQTTARMNHAHCYYYNLLVW